MRPDFAWDETEFIATHNVLPEVGEYETSHQFEVIRPGQKLLLTIWQLDGDGQIDLYQDGIGSPIFHVTLKECAGARVIKYTKGDLQGEFIEFAPAKTFGSRYDGQQTIPYGVRIRVDPHIQIELF